jgi:NAD(P)-dependent dehydrogenase (short-subunit alcohol dehydrogenase family)
LGGERTRVLITGGSYGLGATVTAMVRARGDQVFTISRSAPHDDHRSTWLEADLGDIEAIPALIEALKDRVDGPLDGVVFNAALADKSRSQWTVDQVERHFRINALSPFALWESLEKADLTGNPCNVVLMGSFLQNGNVRQPAYAMSKAALWAWMRSYTMRQDIDDPVSMNMVWPGRVITPANPLRDLPAGDPNSFYPPERVAEVVLGFLYQSPGGPRGTVVDLGRS